MANHVLPRVLAVRPGMALVHPVSAPGIEIVPSADGLARWAYVGDAAALIAAGLAREGWLPGTAHCPNRGLFTVIVGERKVAVRKLGRGRFVVGFRGTRQEDREFWDRRTLDNADRGNETSAQLQSDHDASDDPPKRPITTFDDDAEWPPRVAHDATIERGNGSRWHYLANGQALLLAGLLDADEIPGNPACKCKWRTSGWTDGIPWQATRLGNNVALTLLAQHAAIICCPPLNFKPR